MKKTYLIISLSCFQFGISQIPPGYYDNATGTNYILKTQLYNIINQQNDQGYNAIDGFFADYDLDNYYENDNSILDKEYEKMDIFNLEYPKTLGDYKTDILNPRNSWNNKLNYDKYRDKLSKMFIDNFSKYSDHELFEELVESGPK